MAYFYVRDDGTATGDAGRAASARTGTFDSMGASAFYSSVAACFSTPTTPATNGDEIRVSDAYTGPTSSQTYDNGVSDNTVTTIVSVSDTNCDQYSRGANETVSGSSDIIIKGRHAIHGMLFQSDDDIWFDESCSQILFVDCRFELTGSSDQFYFSDDGACVEFIDCDFVFATGALFNISNGNKCVIRGGTFSGGTDFIAAGGFAGGAIIVCEAIDLSSLTGYLVEDIGGNPSGDDLLDFRFINCQLNASVTYNEEAFTGRNYKLLVQGCGSTSAEAEYQYYYTCHGCTVEDDTSRYRNNSQPYPSGTKTSLKVITGSDINEGNPFHFDFPTRAIDLSDTKTVTIHLASNTALDDADVWVDLIYADGTDRHTPNYVTSRASDIFSGTTLTTPSPVEDWKGNPTNVYEIDIDTSSNLGSDCVPLIRIYVGIPSATIYFCGTLEVS